MTILYSSIHYFYLPLFSWFSWRSGDFSRPYKISENNLFILDIYRIKGTPGKIDLAERKDKRKNKSVEKTIHEIGNPTECGLIYQTELVQALK